jgi:hypothetical protein
MPAQARFFNSTEQHIEPSTTAEPVKAASEPAINTTAPVSQNSNTIFELPRRFGPREAPKAPADLPPPKPLSDSIKTLLPLLNAQPQKYVSALIHGKPYLLTVGDSVRLPFHMPGVNPGDVLRLNRASAIGSRDYTLKGEPHVDERLFECRAIVMGTEGEPARIKIKKKQRNRRKKTVISKHKFTVLKLSELRVKDLEELETEVKWESS